jgi:metal-responsive CopG/Arc/MetJ family transcriptional regulator
LRVIFEYAIMAGMTDKPATAKAETKPLQVKLKPELLAKLDDLRRGRSDFATRSDLIRELIEKAHSTRKRS